ncbi:coiled-coil domain-containing protein 160 homolog [Lineus longissimus]|uniref:coiled-coil domain-containing protein 160 homolog n=1 Tax=Lineus longissimus TaxID=88925 RepID=UPI00315D884E
MNTSLKVKPTVKQGCQLKAMRHFRDPAKDEEQEEGESHNQNQHWIEKLFPPTYAFDHSDVVEKPYEEPKGIIGTKLERFDAEKMREIFHRVHALYMFEEEFERAKKAEKEGNPHDLSKEIQQLEKVKDEPSDVDIEDSTLWDAQEIGVLRSVFKEAKRQNRKMQIVLEVKLRQLWSVEKKYKEQHDLLDTSTKLLNEAKAANERQDILVANLHGHLKCEKQRVHALIEEIKELKLKNVDLNDHIQMLRIDLDRERRERRRKELDLEEQNQASAREQILREERVDLLHEQEVVKLHDQIHKLEEELAKEKQDHATTKRGLDHLRTHFASLPFGGTVSSGCDKLKKLALY